MSIQRRKSNLSKGQALAEFALTVPIFLIFVFGIMDLARVLIVLSQVIDATRQAVRYGIVVGLDDTTTPQYFDCDGIRNAARNVPGLLGLTGLSIDVYYETPDGTFIDTCHSDMSPWLVTDGDVLAVHVSGQVSVLTPVLSNFTDTVKFNYTSRRTILIKAIASLDEWPTQPATTTSFTAQADCTDGTIDFFWTPLDYVPDRVEVRSAITGAVVARPNVNNAYCYGCALIPPTDGSNAYYLVSYVGNEENAIASPPSNSSAVSCYVAPPRNTLNADILPATAPSIGGTVWNDKDDNQIIDISDNGLDNVKLYLIDAGPDGDFSTEDDMLHVQVTDKNGYYHFDNLTAGQLYRIDLVYNGLMVGSNPLLLTTNNEPLEIYINVGGEIRDDATVASAGTFDVYSRDGTTYTIAAPADGLTYRGANFGLSTTATP